MKSVVLAAAAALVLSAGTALADGNGAIANNTTTSMGAPAGSPEYGAPRSEVVPGLPRQERRAEENREAGGTLAAQGNQTPVPNEAPVTR